MKPSNEMLSTLNNNLLKTSTAIGKGKRKGKGKGTEDDEICSTENKGAYLDECFGL